MYVIKKMQINKFEPKPIVTARQLYLLNGEKPATITSKDTPECANDPVPYGAKKTQLLGLADDMAKAAYAKHQSAGESKDLKPTNPKDK